MKRNGNVCSIDTKKIHLLSIYIWPFNYALYRLISAFFLSLTYLLFSCVLRIQYPKRKHHLSVYYGSGLALFFFEQRFYFEFYSLSLGKSNSSNRIYVYADSNGSQKKGQTTKKEKSTPIWTRRRIQISNDINKNL